MIEIICIDNEEENSFSSFERPWPGKLDGIESLFNQDQLRVNPNDITVVIDNQQQQQQTGYIQQEVFVDQVNFLAPRSFLFIHLYVLKNSIRVDR